jgi:hypothetical protein
MVKSRRPVLATPEDVLDVIRSYSDIFWEFSMIRTYDTCKVALSAALEFVLLREFGSNEQRFKVYVNLTKSEDGNSDIFDIDVKDHAIKMEDGKVVPDYKDIPVFASIQYVWESRVE